jgi:small subunit ribosomal protein S18
MKDGDMAAHGKDRSRTKPTDTKGRVRRGRPKVCMFCAQHITWVDYKDTNLLRRFITDRGKIKARTNTGTCAQHQRDVALALKTARELVMLPYLVRTLAADKSAGRRGGGGSGRGPGRPGERPAEAAVVALPGDDDADAVPAFAEEVAAGRSGDGRSGDAR